MIRIYARRPLVVAGLLVAPITILLTIALPLFAALNDAQALKKARDTFGDQAMIGFARDNFQTNWTRQVGFKSTGCQQSFTVVGASTSTWDAAFADAAAHPYLQLGPYKDTLTISAYAYDSGNGSSKVTAIRFYIDGKSYPQILAPNPGPAFSIAWPLDTKTLTTGLHVGCAESIDVDNGIGRTDAFLFLVDQTAGTANAKLSLISIDPVINLSAH